MSNVQEALKAREERKKKEQEESLARLQAKKDKIDSAVEAYRKRKTSNAQGAVSDFVTRINAEVEAAKNISTPSWGKDAYKKASESYKSNHINVSDLMRELEGYKSYIDEDTYNTLYEPLSSLKSGYDSYFDTVNLMTQFDSEESYNAWYEEASKMAEEEQKIFGDPDFEYYSQRGASVENPSWNDSFAPLDIFGWKPFGDGAQVNNMVTFAKDNEMELVTQNLPGEANDDRSSFLNYINLYMTDKEKSIYNYYIGKGDSQKAEEYLESLKDSFAQRHAGVIVEQAEGNILEPILAFSAGFEGALAGFGNIDNLIMGTEADPTSALQYANATMMGNNEGIAKVGSDVVHSIGNMLPSVLVSVATANPTVGAVTLGTSAAGNGYKQMRDLGYNEWQARFYGTAVGASEALLQKAIGGIGALGGKGNGIFQNLAGKVLPKIDNALGRIAIDVGSNMADEFVEEAVQSVLDPIFKMVATGEDFEGIDIEEVVYSGLLGALTAGAMEGTPTIWKNSIGSYKTGKAYSGNLGKTFNVAGKTLETNQTKADKKALAQELRGALIDEALDIAPDNAHAQRMKARLDGGKNVSGYQLNRLVEANESAMRSQDTTKIKTATEERLAEVGEKGDVGKLADILVKQAKGENLTRAERSAIKKSTYGQRVANELDPENIKSGKYASEWAENIGTERINADVYNKDGAADVYAIAVKQASATEPPEEEDVGKNTIEIENATEAKFEASTDGKTKIGDMEVSIKEIASVKDGEVILRLEDGSTVKASDVEYGSSDEIILYENVARMNLNAATANAFINGYDPSMSAELYAKGFDEAYRYGKYNFPIQEMSADGFSSMLTDPQRNLAYNLGKTDAKYNLESKQAKIASISAKNSEKIASKGTKKGKLHNTLKPTNERQKASLKALGVLAEGLGIDIYTFESPVVNGKRQGANGWYDPKDGSIHIDLYAGVDGKGTMLFTAAHELTHFIREWSPSKFKVFADFLLEQYGKKGISVDALVSEQIAKAKRNGRGISYDTAYEEVIADSCEAMLADGDVITKIADLKAKDKTLWQKIKSFLADLVERIKAVYKGMTPDSVEGRYVAEMLDKAEKLKALWTEALVEASDAYNASEIVNIDTESESVSPMLSERTWTASEYVTKREETAKKIAEALGVSKAKALSYIDSINSIAKMIADDRARLDYEASSFGSAFVSNVEYGGSFDYTTLCKKRRIYTGTFSEIQRRLKDVALTPDDVLTIRNLLIEEGIEATCGLCYVEGSRANMGKFAKEFIRLYKEENPTAWIPNMADVNTPDGVEQMRINHPEAYDRYVYFWNHYGKLKDSDPALFASQQKPKLYEARKEYKGEILANFKGDASVAKKNLNGGIRMQSFSDFEIVHLIDTMQVIMDMSTVGLAGQAYTKVPEFAKAFGNTGLKINLSLIAKGVDADGNLIFDDREGMPHKTAFELRDRYSKDVGTIIVTFTDKQLLAAMSDPRIDYIIPFHRSQWKKGQYGAMGLPKGTKDYTFMQNEKLIKQTYHEYQGRMVKDKATNYMPNEYWDFTKSGKENAEAYLKMCAENNKRPKFYKLLDYDGKGTYSLKADGSTDGYWKLLIDFKMYDNNGVASPQQAVTPTFNMDESVKMLNEYKGGHSKYPVASSVVDKFVKQYESKVKYSDRDSYAPTFYSHMGKVVDGIKSEKVGANGVVPYLKGKGVKNEEIKWSGIEAFLEGKKSVTKAELQEFVAGSQLQIVEQMSGTATFIADDGNTYESEAAFRDAAYAIAEKNGIDRSRVKFAIDTKFDMDAYAYVGHPNNSILTAEVSEAEGTSPRWSQYKIDGGENYRELIFQLPDSSYQNQMMRVHWGDEAEGVLAHARIQDITTNDGKKMLFIEEIQSDYHNEGHQSGYADRKTEAKIDELKSIADDKFIAVEDYSTEMTGLAGEWETIERTEKGSKLLREYREAQDAYDNAMNEYVKKIPDAPFRDTYHEYVLKRLLRMAAEEGYDSIGWTPADIQSKRWSDEFAEGYRIEYDQDIPSFLKKYGKKWGATVGTAKITEGYDVWSMSIPDSMKDSVLHEGQVLYSDRSFASQVDAVLNGADTNSTHLKLMDTPSLLQEAGLPNLPILMTAKHLKTITSTSGKVKGNYHGLDVEIVKNLPEYISSPVMIADSLTRNDSVVIITEAIDSQNRPVVAAIMLNGVGQLDNKYVNANIMTSAYGKDNFQSFLNRIAESNSVIYWNKKKSQDLSVNLGLQLPNVITSLRSGVIIHQAKAFVNTQTENNLRSDRDPNSFSNRSLLANALESVAQNDIERNKLKQYKAKIDLINSEQTKLYELREKIKELSFAKGRRDTEAIKSLQFEANQAANRINTYDRQLLNLESTKALKDVLDREKAMAYKKAEQRGKDALAAYRERATKTQRELMTRYQESRKKNVEGRKKTEMRLKIKNITSELNTLLINPTSKKHIKEELRKEVANALSAINMDTIGADERVSHYNEMIAKSKDPDVIAELTKTRDRIQLQGDNLHEKLNALQIAYEKIKKSDDIELSLSYQEVIHNSIKNVSDKVGKTSIRNMTFEQLEMVYDLLSMIRKTIRDANKSFKAKKGETIMQMAEAVNDQVRTVGGQPYKRNVVSSHLQKEMWHLLKPYVAFRTIGSVTFTNLYKELRNGEDTFYGDVKEARAFIEEQYKKHDYKSWDMKKTKTFTAKSGKSFDLTLEQMMTLYAYSRRDQAHKHIIEGGIVFEGAMIVEKNKFGVPIKYEVTTKDAFNLSEETFAEIANSLSAEQKAFVDEMQKYLSVTMGAKGNEVSMEFLGVKLFKEEFYLPIKSSEYYRNFSAEEAGEVKLKSPSFSKETEQHANNPIVLHNFTDLWAEHINDMSMYHSFVLALEDFTRVYNYKTKTDANVETMDTKATLETAYPGVTKYINKFLKDMNGGVRGETVGWAEKLTSLAKKGSVLGSASVAIQQPSAVMRAMAYINPKYFVVTTHKSVNLMKHSQDFEELKKYAPIAGIKEMGRFDVGMGQGTVDWIKSNKTLMNKAEDMLSALPAFMDEVTWVSIWNAVKRETLHTHKNLRPNSEEFLKVAGEKFTDVISLSQVYDSVFSRSDLMRNKSWIAKTLTAFMAEPSTVLNMLWDAWVQAKRSGSMKKFIKVTSTSTGAIVAAIVLNEALKSIVIAGRDDDEDESYAEKYLEHFFGGLKDNLNPLTLVPFAKDIVSIFNGYDVERMDMALFSDLKNAMDAFDSDSKTEYEKWSGLIGAISALFGIPVKNVERDIRAIINTFFGDAEATTKAGIIDAITEGWTGESKSNGQQLYEAMVNGDTAQIDRVKSRFKDQNAIDNAIRKALKENDTRITEAAKAIVDGEYERYTQLLNEIVGDGNFTEKDARSAINSLVNDMTPDEETTDSSKDKEESIYEVEYVYKDILDGDDVMAHAMKEDIIRTHEANGKDREEAEASFNNSFRSYVQKKYDKGELTDYEARRMLVNFGGKTEEQATATVLYWDFKQSNPDTHVDDTWISEYYADGVADAGISIEMFVDYRNKVKGIDGETKKQDRMAVINSLPISNYQKDALYYAEGWAESKLWQAPWH